MEKRDYLMSLEWNTFETYPPQFSSIYLHCIGFNDDKKETHSFIRVNSFNAVNFSPNTAGELIGLNPPMKFLWLPASQIDKNL